MFPYAHVSITGSNPPSSLAGRLIWVCFLDKTDSFPISTGGEADPIALAKTSTATFHNRKCVTTSAPTTRRASCSGAAYEASDQCRYFTPRPDSGAEDTLKRANVRRPEGEPEKLYMFVRTASVLGMIPILLAWQH